MKQSEFIKELEKLNIFLTEEQLLKLDKFYEFVRMQNGNPNNIEVEENAISATGADFSRVMKGSSGSGIFVEYENRIFCLGYVKSRMTEADRLNDIKIRRIPSDINNKFSHPVLLHSIQQRQALEASLTPQSHVEIEYINKWNELITALSKNEDITGILNDINELNSDISTLSVDLNDVNESVNSDISNINNLITILQNKNISYDSYFNLLRGITVYDTSKTLDTYKTTQICVVYSDSEATVARKFPQAGVAGLLIVEAGWSTSNVCRYVYQRYILRDNTKEYCRMYNIDTWTTWVQIR